MAASPPVADRIGLDTFHFFRSQLFYLFPAVLVLIGVSFLTPRQTRRAGFLLFAGSLALMVAALFWGPEIKGAHRWINLGPLNLQPSELAKPGFVIVTAWLLAEQHAASGHTRPSLRLPCRGTLRRAAADAAGLRPDGPDDHDLRRHAADLGPVVDSGCWLRGAGGVWHSHRLCQRARMCARASTASSTPTRATPFRSIRRCRPSRMAVSWEPDRAAAKRS